MLKPIHEATSVKKANLFYNEDSETYSLIHYDTEILIIGKNKEIVKALQCSQSSTRAIYQVADYLDINRQAVKKAMVPFSNFIKYEVGN